MPPPWCVAGETVSREGQEGAVPLEEPGCVTQRGAALQEPLLCWQRGLCPAVEISPACGASLAQAMPLPLPLPLGKGTKQEGSLGWCSGAVGLPKCSCELERRVLKEFSYFAYRVYCLFMVQSENIDAPLESGDLDVSWNP